MNTPVLSICIPTYNRCEWLIKAVQSILDQDSFSKQVAVVISDNGSTDATASQVIQLSSQLSNIRYIRLQENVGFDRNVVNVLTAARGEYCWLLGDDDKLAPGALQRVLSDLRQAPDLLLVNRINCDAEQVPRRREEWLKINSTAAYDFSNYRIQKKYLQQAKSMGALFSYISCLVIRKSALHLLDIPTTILSSGYVHVYLCMRDILQAGRHLRYDPGYLVLCRWPTAVDPAISLGHFLQDVDVYEHFVQELFGNRSEIVCAVNENLRQEHPLRKILFLLSQNPEAWLKIRERTLKIGYDGRIVEWLHCLSQWRVIRYFFGRFAQQARRLIRGV